MVIVVVSLGISFLWKGPSPLYHLRVWILINTYLLSDELQRGCRNLAFAGFFLFLLHSFHSLLHTPSSFTPKMQNNQITIADRDLNDSIDFLAKYGNSFWSYIRGEGTVILFVSGAILLIIAGAASSSDSHLHKPGWVYVCFALVVFFGAWIVTFFVCNFIDIVSSLFLVLVFALLCF